MNLVKNMLYVGSDFSGVGAFDEALKVLGIRHRNIFACDSDDYARKTYTLNQGRPYYFPKDVYDRDVPIKSLDIYMTSPPCQGFSLAGNRRGSVLFFNSHDFIKKNKPRFFVFENVKGLLSHDKKNKEHKYGNTFNTWINYLGGKSVNGNPVMFPIGESVPYHIYYKVVNAKNYNIPQNRERVFIVGIRDDVDNVFSWPKNKELKVKLKDVLEKNVDEKYFLSSKMIKGLRKEGKSFSGRFKPKSGDESYANCITTRSGRCCTDNFIKIGYINQNSQASRVFSDKGISPSLSAGTHGYANGYVSTGENTTQMLEVDKDNVVVCQDKIRRLTPRECFRIQDFRDDFILNVSDTQAYKQAGNSIPVGMLAEVIKGIKSISKHIKNKNHGK